MSTIKSLLKASAVLDMIGGDYGTALHTACATGRVEATKLLLDHGAKMEVSGEDGTVISAIDAAKYHPRVLEVLRKPSMQITRIPDDGVELGGYCEGLSEYN